MKKIVIATCAFILAYTQAFASNQSLPGNPLNNSQDFDKIAYNWSRTFAQVLQLAHQKHYKIADLEQSMIKAIDAFLSDLDPHSSFLDPKTYKLMLQSTSGEFFGIGIVIDNTRKPKDKYLTIVDTIPGGPADKVDVKPFDKIIEIDGQPLEGMSTEQATSKLKGPRNTKVHIKVLRENQQDLLPFDIVRDVIKEQNSLSFYIKNHNIYYISLTMFTENAVKQIERLLKQAQNKPYKGLILDLRNNSGGLLSAAIEISGLFLEKGSLVVETKNKEGKVTERYTTKKNPITSNSLPIFILINNYTASAAEILAACLKSHAEQAAQKNNKNNALVFLAGTNTFGKGSVQEVIPVGNNSAAKITTSLYFPNKMNIQGVGIAPDFVIKRTFPPTEQMQWFSKYYGKENALNNSIKTGSESETATAIKSEKKSSTDQPKKPKRWAERAKEMLQTDNQLRETITLINMLSTFKQLCPKEVCNRQKAITYLKKNYITNDKLEIEEIKA